MKLLKSAKLLVAVKRAGGSIQQLGKPALVAAIDQLKEEARGQALSSGLELRDERTADGKGLQEKGIHSCCGGPALSRAARAWRARSRACLRRRR